MGCSSWNDFFKYFVPICETLKILLICIVDFLEGLPLANTPDVFGLHPNAEIGYYTNAAKEMWAHLVELQPQTSKINHYIQLHHKCGIVSVCAIMTSLTLLRGHPKMSTFSWVYKQYTFSDPLPLPYKCTDQHVCFKIWASCITFFVQQQKVTVPSSLFYM